MRHADLVDTMGTLPCTIARCLDAAPSIAFASRLLTHEPCPCDRCPSESVSTRDPRPPISSTLLRLDSGAGSAATPTKSATPSALPRVAVRCGLLSDPTSQHCAASSPSRSSSSWSSGSSKRLSTAAYSLQHVRRAAAVAAETFHTAHPFASRRVYTDGARVFAALAAGPTTPDLIALTRRDVLQVIAGGIFEPFSDEIDFDETTAYASRWWPLGRQVPIVLDPRVAFGAPVIAGTRLRTTLIAGLAHETTEPAVADTYIVGVAAVRAAVRFESMLAAA